MTLDIQFRLKSNPLYIKYLRENSYWYKILMRQPEKFKEFEEEVKERYHLRPTDRMNRVLDTVEMIQALMSTMK